MNLSDSRRRVFLVGIDGATWANLKLWIDQGHLPNFGCILSDGAWGILKSTRPPLSPPAWTSIFTGVNPGKHSIYSFVKYRPARSYTISPISSHDVLVPPIWDILNKSSRTGVYINIPFSYPPPVVQGVFTSGLGTPGKGAAFASPTGFRDEVIRLYPDYDVDFNEGLGRAQISLPRIYAINQAHMNVFKHTVEKTHRESDFYAIVLRSLDVLQHFYWEREDTLLEFFRQIDDFLGWVISILGDHDSLLICSDHGFRGVDKRVYVNEWLRAIGLLTVRNGQKPLSILPSMEHIHRLLVRGGLRKLAWKIKQTPILPFVAKIFPSRAFEYQTRIDWGATKVFFWEGSSGLLRLNVSGREPQGSVPKNLYSNLQGHVIEAATSLVEKETGRGVITLAEKAEDVYWGSEVLPDVVLSPGPGYVLSSGFSRDGKIFEAEKERGGEHAPEGILALLGRHIPSIRLPDHVVYDVTPTILGLLGQQIPTYMDGKALPELNYGEELHANHSPPDST